MNNDYGTPSFLKRIHVSSDESDFSEKQARKKTKRNSEVEDLPSYLRGLDISLKSDVEEWKEALKRKRQRFLEKKRLKKRKRENNQLITNGDQESQSCVSISQPSLAQNKPSYSVTSVPSLSAEIVVLQHPTSVTLHKFIDVKVISGGISILGWNMTSLSEKVTIFSYERTGLIELTTLHADPMWKTKETCKSIKTALKEIIGKEDTIKILEKCGNSSVIVMLQRAAFTSPLKILSIYYPRESWLPTDWKNNRHFIKKKSSHQVIKFTVDHVTVAEAIAHAMRKATVNAKNPAPRVVICGNSHTGKSTVARFIINRLLEMFSHVFYLDADPGQPEFTPPGVVSLSKVDKCMIGPPFSHLRKPMKMVFTGAISAEASPPMYFKSIKQLTQQYFKEHSSETLIVNTMGWMQ
ncbi:polynucleotide 5'-hydroxyl-kinase NOL9-like, partial [Uloborus diversus]